MSTGTRKSVSSTSTASKKAAAPQKAAPAKRTAAPKRKAAAKPAPAPARRGESMPAPRPAAAAPARRIPAGVPAASSPAHEVMLARVESVRLAQRTEGNFDCFGRAGEGYCDQGGCSYRDECLTVSRLLHEL